MKTTGRAVLLRALALVLIPVISACGDDGEKPPVGREPRTILVPGEMDLEEAGREAVAGDTLLLSVFFPLPPVTQTVAFRSDQTPLVIRGDKSLPLVTGGGFALLRFDGPRAGTTIEAVAFGGGAPAIAVTGAGQILIADCRFTGGTVHIHADGTGLTVRAEGNLLEDAALFGIDTAGGTQLLAHQNTIVDAGDCGVRLAGSSDGVVTANIIAGSANFGIACLEGASLLAESGCNDVFDSANGPYTGCAAAATDFNKDPQFCDAARGIYTLVDASPCAAANSGGCGRVGARDVDCEPPLPATGPPRLLRGSR